MIHSKTKTCRKLLWLLCLSLPLSLAWGGTFTVKITPANSGQVIWTCSDPQGQGVFTGKGGKFPYTMNVANILLTFVPNTGGSIVKVMTNEGDDTAWVLAHSNTDSWSGPSENSKSLMVVFSGGTVTVEIPTGSFPFVFPTNNLSLTAIADISGTYTGKTPTAAQRNYNVDVAQDQDGKVAAMGTVDGIIPKGGSPSDSTMSGNIGSIKTLNSEPTAQVKGKFEGTRDGTPVSVSGSGQGPVEVTDIGGGTNGVTGTASYSANIGGVPFTAKNTPMAIPTPPTPVSHIHKAWSVQLEIQSKVSPKTGKSFIAATAVLTLPNGDVISYPERAAKYSTKTGYSLSFKGGTNTTANAPDKKSTITIKGMTMVKQGSVWNPTAGTLSYSFLGQKGSGDLMNFVE